MRKFSVRPTLTLRGRTFKGLRGWSGKPLHPPLTDVPIVAYLFTAGFDVASTIAGDGHRWARELWHAGTFVLAAGAIVSVLTALTGLWDAWRSSEAGTQARRTINTHAAIMVTVTLLVIVNLIWRIGAYDSHDVAPAGIAVLSAVIAGLVALGATFGGSLVFEYGFNVETAGKSPVWEKSETDVLPGDHVPPAG